MTKFLSYEDRPEIESGLKEHLTFTEIGKRLGRDRTTITKEVRNYSVEQDTGYSVFPHNTCKCWMLMRSHVMERYLGKLPEDDLVVENDVDGDEEESMNLTYHTLEDGKPFMISGLNTEQGSSELFGLQMKTAGNYKVSAKMRAAADTQELSQMALSVFVDNQIKGTFRISGANKEWTEQCFDMELMAGNHYIRFYVSMEGMELGEVRLEVCL